MSNLPNTAPTMTENHLAFRIIAAELNDGADLLDALTHAAEVIRDERAAGPVKGHSHDYRAVYDNLGQSRATCVRGLTVVCSVVHCPRHDAGAYADAMARHATDTI